MDFIDGHRGCRVLYEHGLFQIYTARGDPCHRQLDRQWGRRPAIDTLSRDVAAAILNNPAGANKTLSPQACSYSTTDNGGTITITLTNAGPPAFDAYQKYLVNPQPLPDVGDKASQSMIGIVALKGTDRNCSIDAGGAPDALRIRGAELGRKLGEICNQLFALP